MKTKPYQETHFQGNIFIEQPLQVGVVQGDIGIQISDDGRIWICINGKATIRFKASNIEKEKNK